MVTHDSHTLLCHIHANELSISTLVVSTTSKSYRLGHLNMLFNDLPTFSPQLTCVLIKLTIDYNAELAETRHQTKHEDEPWRRSNLANVSQFNCLWVFHLSTNNQLLLKAPTKEGRKSVEAKHIVQVNGTKVVRIEVIFLIRESLKSIFPA
jgi:hypothetical protein